MGSQIGYDRNSICFGVEILNRNPRGSQPESMNSFPGLWNSKMNEEEILKRKRRGQIIQALTLATEFSLYIVASIGIGYFLGAMISNLASAIGIMLGAIFGFALAIKKALDICK